MIDLAPTKPEDNSHAGSSATVECHPIAEQ